MSDPFSPVEGTRRAVRPSWLDQFASVGDSVKRFNFAGDVVRRYAFTSGVLKGVRVPAPVGIRFAENYPAITGWLPQFAQTPALKVGSGFTGLITRSPAVSAFAESQNISVRVTGIVRFPSVTPPANIFGTFNDQLLSRMSEQLTVTTRHLAGIRMPTALALSTFDSAHAWRLVLDDVGRSASPLGLRRASFAGTHALSTAAGVELLRPVDLVDGDGIKEPEPRFDADLTLQIGQAARAELRLRLGQIDERLVERFDGAWNTLAQSGPDAASQAAHSIQELLDWALRLTAPDDEVLAWHARIAQKPDDLAKGRPTRSLRTRFLLRDRTNEHDPARLFLNSIGGIVDTLQGAKHSLEDPYGRQTIQCVLLTVEGFLGFVLAD